MLLVREIVRDILCNELVNLNKCIISTSCAASKDIAAHVSNMASILMSSVDFIHVETSMDEVQIKEAVEQSERNRQWQR